jgi:hypothetical protein
VIRLVVMMYVRFPLSGERGAGQLFGSANACRDGGLRQTGKSAAMPR